MCFLSIFLLLLSPLIGVLHVQAAGAPAPAFKVCAFNLHRFGESKSKKQDVMLTLAKIIVRCNVSLLQEVQDSGQKAVPELMKTINSFDRRHEYSAVSSERLGRGTYQEQYVFVYRSDTVTLTGQYQYHDKRPGDVDAFAREPFVVRFKAPKTAIKEFVLIPLHTSPENTTKELDSLYDVLQYVRKMWKTENVMLLGDFNADCRSLPKKDRDKIRLLTEDNLHWLIKDNMDTTVRSSTTCAYDRIVVHGDAFSRAIVPFSAKPFDFQKEYKLTEDQALVISDHFPVEVQLRDAASRLASSLLPLILLSLLLCS
ncbi:deoxyribonuclease-1-like 1 isoform X1 [Synchiropus splendidus]|uniref:deoxyribonuclease-1-like 1 isoform X1 n=1 Tax=Synchiropus splendidus TaxID=270530 RepID=UPI00237DB7C1|nr:deoxyribonuclease-1-like 1 isoform X1 [Synchiropus splendidus]